jgi:hypothetical protein
MFNKHSSTSILVGEAVGLDLVGTAACSEVPFLKLTFGGSCHNTLGKGKKGLGFQFPFFAKGEVGLEVHYYLP